MLQEMQKNSKELEDILAKLNIKKSKNISSSAKLKSPLSLQESKPITLKNQQTPAANQNLNQVNSPESQSQSKMSLLRQEGSNSLMTDSDEIRKIIQDKVLIKSKSNELRVIKEASNLDDDNIEEKGNQLVQKLKEGIKETKEGVFVIHSQQDQASNKNTSFASKEKSPNPLAKTYDLESKYEYYNTQKLAYQAYKNFSHCHSNASKFLQRMKFYSIKNQTKNELIDLLVHKSKPKMKEQTRVITFNRLIQDSNRRAEAKNRVELLSSNNQLANNFYETDTNLIMEHNKKFSQQKWDKVIERFNDNEQKKHTQRKEKYETQRKEAKEKEQREVDEMKKYNKKASKQTIEAISDRLYQKAMEKQLRSREYSQANSIRNLRVETDISIRRFSNQKNKKNCNSHKKNHSSNEWLHQKTSHCPKRKMMNEKYNQKNSLNKKQKGYVPFVSAEKIVNGFFRQNYLKTYYH